MTDSPPENSPEPGESPTETVRELRCSPRRGYRYVQNAAPLIGNRMPSQNDFFPVQCRDISGGGIALVFEFQPDFEYLVIALGTRPNVEFLAARIVRTKQFIEDGWPRYLVGCEFVKKVALH